MVLPYGKNDTQAPGMETLYFKRRAFYSDVFLSGGERRKHARNAVEPAVKD
jgi:hypothetical protein